MAHICHGWEGVGVGVRGAAAFWAWNLVQVSHYQTASSMALFMPDQKTHPHANNWALVILDGTGGVVVVPSPFLMEG